ncbi:MAG: ELWxxDGT repeat protein [Bacillota bacterium]
MGRTRIPQTWLAQNAQRRQHGQRRRDRRALRAGIGPCIEGLEERRLLSAVMVKDLDSTPTGSDPNNLIDVNGTVFFTADDGIHGRELWKTDGTPGGTVCVKDIEPSVSSPKFLAFARGNGALFFVARTSDGTRLWKSDGTDAGTVAIASIRSDVGAFEELGNIVSIDSDLYFIARFWEGGTGRMVEQLWKSDGTAAGTGAVKTFQSYAYTTNPPAQLTSVDGTLFFACADAEHGAELWRSDGTDAGTTMVEDINPGAGGSSVTNLTVVGKRVYFSASDGVHGQELWMSDGTEAGTSLVQDINSGSGDSSPAKLCAVGNSLYFVANDGANGVGVWKTDGAPGGTSLVKDLSPSSWYPDGTYIDRTQLVAFGETLIFTAINESGGTSALWRSDGTSQGTEKISPLSFPWSVSKADAVVMNGKLYCVDSSGWLYVTDGTSAGTVVLANQGPGADPMDHCERLTASNDRLVFVGTDSVNGSELWTSDGTGSGTKLVKRINQTTQNGTPTHLAALGDVVLFDAYSDSPSSHEIWRSDGTAAGTVRLFNNYIAGSVVSDGHFAYVPTYNTLWVTDGTAAGTRMLWSGTSNARDLTLVNGRLFFIAKGTSNSLALWTSDGTPEGTRLLRDIESDAWLSDAAKFVDVNGTLYFTDCANVFADGTGQYGHLWKSDGTPEGTVQVSSVLVPYTQALPALANRNGTLFFLGYSGDNTWALWKTDGSTAGTVMVKDLGGVCPAYLVNVDGTLLFGGAHWATGGYSPDGPGVVWKSDGSTEGTVRIKSFGNADRVGRFGPWGFTSLNGRAVFVANDGVHGEELWVTDGTETGTVMLKDIFPGSWGASIEELTRVGDVVFFSAVGANGSGVSDRELWRTDGTPDGTVVVKDVIPGIRGSDPHELTNVNGTLFFAADDGIHGTELWVVAPPIADAGGPYVGVVDDAVRLNAWGSSDPDPNEMLAYTWDLDGDGVFGETGKNAARGEETGTLVGFSTWGAQPGTYTVRVRVTNTAGLSSVATSTVTVLDSAVAGTAGDDEFVLRKDLVGNTLVYRSGSDVPPLVVPNKWTGTLRIAGNGGHDVLRIDCSNGDPLDFQTPLATLRIESGSVQVQMVNGPKVLRIANLSFGEGASLDLGDNLLVSPFVSGDPEKLIDKLTGYVRSAYSDAEHRWQGPGLTSSLAQRDPRMGLAVVPNRLEDGQLLDPSVDANAVLVKCTLNGDVNLDGKVDGDDYFLADSGFLTQAEGYRNGDLNYDGKVDGDDYFLIDSAFIGQDATHAGAVAAVAWGHRH